MKNIDIIIVVAIAFFFLSSGVRASPFQKLDEYEAEQMQRAATSEQFLELKNKVNRIRVLLRSCEIQVDNQVLPHRCFEADREVQDVVELQGLIRERWDLETLCAEIAQKTSELEMPKPNVYFSEKCAKIASERVKLNRYKSGHGF